MPHIFVFTCINLFSIKQINIFIQLETTVCFVEESYVYPVDLDSPGYLETVDQAIVRNNIKYIPKEQEFLKIPVSRVDYSFCNAKLLGEFCIENREDMKFEIVITFYVLELNLNHLLLHSATVILNFSSDLVEVVGLV